VTRVIKVFKVLKEPMEHWVRKELRELQVQELREPKELRELQVQELREPKELAVLPMKWL
jgi:hypothetical protein